MIYWGLPYGWRAGERYVAPGASAADVVRFEREEHGNELDVPDFLLEELERKGLRACDVVWVCRTEEHARRYGSVPYQEPVGPSTLVLATDGEDETGYLVLPDASVLDPVVIQRYALYRQGLVQPSLWEMGSPQVMQVTPPRRHPSVTGGRAARELAMRRLPDTQGHPREV